MPPESWLFLPFYLSEYLLFADSSLDQSREGDSGKCSSMRVEYDAKQQTI